MVVMDFGCRYQGYNSDFTRTIAVGKPTPEIKKIYQIVLEAQTKAIATAKQGQFARSVDAVARKHIRKSGYGRYFIHSLGHGLGLNVHEPLRLSSVSKEVLQTGNVVTVEPGIYIPGFAGVRIEDVIVICDTNCDILTTSSKKLIIL
jgi:Xaa-Pro aminopeptidase